MSHRLLVLQNTVAPYRIPLFGALARLSEFDVRILYSSNELPHRQWKVKLQNPGFTYVIQSSWGLSVPRLDWSPRLSMRTWSNIGRYRPDAMVVGGYADPDAWLAWLYARYHRIPLVLWTGSTLSSSRIQRGLPTTLRRLFFNGVDAFVTYGTEATKFLVRHGVDRDRIVTGCNVGDVEFFSQETSRLASGDESAASRTGGITFLFVGQLIERKGVRELVDAFASADLRSSRLLVVGDGPLRPDLERAAAQREGNISFLGFVQKEALSRHFAESDVMVVPSLREVFSIAVSEGLAGGLFVVASRYSGEASDLIVEGLNGLVVDPKDPVSLRASLRRAMDIVQSPEFDRPRIRESLVGKSIEDYAGAILSSIRLARARGKTGRTN